jgi:hypothetical protein
MTDSNRTPRPENPDDRTVEEMTDAERRERQARLDREQAGEAARSAGDVSPHFGRRAQPGDILGIETGGETTEIGDTAEDEDERRRRTEKDAPR